MNPDWVFDTAQLLARHKSGLTLSFKPADDDLGGYHGEMVSDAVLLNNNLDAAELAKLAREAGEGMAAALKNPVSPRADSSKNPVSPRAESPLVPNRTLTPEQLEAATGIRASCFRCWADNWTAPTAEEVRWFMAYLKEEFGETGASGRKLGALVGKLGSRVRELMTDTGNGQAYKRMPFAVWRTWLLEYGLIEPVGPNVPLPHRPHRNAKK